MENVVRNISALEEVTRPKPAELHGPTEVSISFFDRIISYVDTKLGTRTAKPAPEPMKRAG